MSSPTGHGQGDRQSHKRRTEPQSPELRSRDNRAIPKAEAEGSHRYTANADRHEHKERDIYIFHKNALWIDPVYRSWCRTGFEIKASILLTTTLSKQRSTWQAVTGGVREDRGGCELFSNSYHSDAFAAPSRREEPAAITFHNERSALNATPLLRTAAWFSYSKPNHGGAE